MPAFAYESPNVPPLNVHVITGPDGNLVDCLIEDLDGNVLGRLPIVSARLKLGVHAPARLILRVLQRHAILERLPYPS